MITAQIEVFRTNVSTMTDARFLVEELSAFFPAHDFHFDIEDCDRILRVETRNCELQAVKIMTCLDRWGFHCEVLNDSI